MTTFVLKKYEETNTSTNNESELNTNQEKSKEQIMINVEGSVSEIVAKALYKVLTNKVEITEINETPTEETSNVKAISTEDINTDPLATFNTINSNDIVFIQNHGFKTSQEEWFLTNIPNKTSNVFYSVESLIHYVVVKLGV